MSESKYVPDGVDSRAAMIAIVFEITNRYQEAFRKENDIKGNLRRFVNVFNQVDSCLSSGDDFPLDFIDNLMK